MRFPSRAVSLVAAAALIAMAFAWVSHFVTAGVAY